MKLDIDIEAVAARLRPHMNEIEAEFDRENDYFLSLASNPSDSLGRVLKSHLIVEHYLDRALTATYAFRDIDELRLSFWQKTMMLPDSEPRYAFVKPAILELNALRNRLSHKIGSIPKNSDIKDINSLLEIARPSMEFRDTSHRVEIFASVACVFLIPKNPRITEIFSKAFAPGHSNGT